MKKSLLTMAAAAFALFGCNQTDTLGVNAPETSIAANSGVSNPGTPVFGEFEITTSTGEATGYSVKNAGNDDNDYCTDAGALMKPDGGTDEFGNPTFKQTGSQVPSAQCVPNATEVITVTVTCDVTANYVLAKNGNINLNFQTCGGDAECEDTFVHYRSNRNQNDTRGNGVLTCGGDDGSTWTIDLSQINHSGNEQIAARELTGLTATSGDDTANDAVLTW
jgi:hypothetical protein